MLLLIPVYLGPVLLKVLMHIQLFILLKILQINFQTAPQQTTLQLKIIIIVR